MTVFWFSEGVQLQQVTGEFVSFREKIQRARYNIGGPKTRQRDIEDITLAHHENFNLTNKRNMFYLLN